MRIRVNKLSFDYFNKTVLKDLSFELEDGDFLLVHGKNGTGKTTLVKCMLKELRIADKMIMFNDKDINHIGRFKNIGFVSQIGNFNYEFPITVAEILICAYRKKQDEFFESVLRILDLGSIYRENINNLSGGQLQRVFIARALLNKPQLLILDEPTTGVDQENILVLHRVLRELKKAGKTIVLISHDLSFCTDIADYTLTLLDNFNYIFERTTGENNAIR